MGYPTVQLQGLMYDGLQSYLSRAYHQSISKLVSFVFFLSSFTWQSFTQAYFFGKKKRDNLPLGNKQSDKKKFRAARVAEYALPLGRFLKYEDPVPCEWIEQRR